MPGREYEDERSECVAEQPEPRYIEIIKRLAETADRIEQKLAHVLAPVPPSNDKSEAGSELLSRLERIEHMYKEIEERINF